MRQVGQIMDTIVHILHTNTKTKITVFCNVHVSGIHGAENNCHLPQTQK